LSIGPQAISPSAARRDVRKGSRVSRMH
jgi:hypothetical protein